MDGRPPSAAPPGAPAAERLPHDQVRPGHTGHAERARERQQGPDHDRWEWRRRIRADPRKRHAYRILVGVVGTLLVLLGLATGWLPGPGGIPLCLAGLAVLASEFEWARRLLDRARAELHRFTRWAGRQPLWLRWAGSAAGLLAVLAAVYAYLVLFGAPGLLPAPMDAQLERLPGIDG